MGDPSDDSSSNSHLRDKKGGLDSSTVTSAVHPNTTNTLARDPNAAPGDYFTAIPINSDIGHHDTTVRPHTSPQILACDHARNGTQHITNGVLRNTSVFTSPSNDIKAESEKPTALGIVDSGGNSVAAGSSAEDKPKKPSIPIRAKNGCIRFAKHTKDALTRTWFNLLLVFVPVGIIVKALNLNPALIFAMNAVAIVPLAGLLTHATESVACRLGDTWGALLNVSFGNAVELIIFIIALAKNEIRIVQASLIGSILANLLLILGMAFLLGGLRFQEQIYNSTVTQMSACLLSLAVMSLLLPTAFHASFSDTLQADNSTLKISRGTSVVLLLVYVLYLLFQLKSHAYLYESMPQAQLDAEAQPGILAEIMDSSTSSSSSDDSSSDTDTTSGSHTTAKRRIKKFIRRTRRKSSSTSDHTTSHPSFLAGSPVEEGRFDLVDRRASTAHSLFDQSRRNSRHSVVLQDIASGDEGDVEMQRRTTANPRIKDFQTGETSLSPERLKALERSERKERKHRRHQRRKKAKSLFSRSSEKHDERVLDEKAPDLTQKEASTVERHPPKPTVNFAPKVEDTDGSAMKISDSQPKRPFGLRQISTTAKPEIRRYLTQNVFVSGPPALAPTQSSLGIRMPISGANVAAAAHAAPAKPHFVKASPAVAGLQRTNSLPDRLNKTSSTPNETQQRKPLPPYVMRVPPETVSAVAVEPELVVPEMSRTSAVVMLLVSTALVAICAEFLVDAIPEMTASSAVSQAFIGLIILPIVGNAAEHVTAVTVATKNKMDLAIGVAVGSSIQIALFVTPLVVILGWIMDKNMSLYFNLFETVALFVTVFVVNFLVLDGKSNYLEGALLICSYVIIAVAAFFYPDTAAQSLLGGSGSAE